jgi:hypothetical protein
MPTSLMVSHNIFKDSNEIFISRLCKTISLGIIVDETLGVGKHHKMDPIMEGILSCSLASSRGKPPNEIHTPNRIILIHNPLHCLNLFI